MGKKFLTILPIITMFMSCHNSNWSSGELYPINSNGVCGYINSKGEMVIPPQFDDADYFYDDVALVYIDGGIGYINKEGTFVVEPKYYCGTFFSNGRAFVMKDDGTIVCIDKEGNTCFTLPYDCVSVQSFFEGRAQYATDRKSVV